MAVYEFECESCGERFEVSAPVKEHDRLKEQPPECPKCGERQTRQQVTMFGCKTPSGY
jgi:putative FmdB family regulatory protein